MIPFIRHSIIEKEKLQEQKTRLVGLGVGRSFKEISYSDGI